MTMTSKERVLAAINHGKPDKIPIDIGASNFSGISVTALYRLKKHLGLGDRPINVYEIAQMLGYVEDDVRRILKGDVVGVRYPTNHFGVPHGKQTKDFIMPDGTPTLIEEENEYDVLENGKVVIYPRGNRDYKPSAMMPAGGYFFDNINRAPEFDEDDLDARRDYKDYFIEFTDDDASWLEKEAKRLNEESGCAVMGMFGRGNLGSSFFYSGPWEFNPRGIREYADWNMAQILYPDYVNEVFEMQVENVTKNLEIYKQACGDNIQIICMSGTDFGTQNGLLFSKEMFQELYKPYFKRMNDWVHENTNWKVFFHSCGAIYDLLDDFVEMGVDILNPVQISAAGMEAENLKKTFGDKLVFWGGGVDTQNVMPNGTPQEVYEHVQKRLKILAEDGGYVFSTEHNIMGNISPENIVACYKAAYDY